MTFRFLICLLAVAPLGLAQRMGMGPGMGSANPDYGYMRMFLGNGSGGMMGSGMGFGMTGDLTLGPDGTAYVMRALPSPSATTIPVAVWTYELDAVSPINGNILWRLPISGGRVSQPVLSNDGLIFVTLDDYQLFQPSTFTGMWSFSSPQTQNSTAKLLAISHTANSASIASTTSIASDVLSAPILGVDPAGGYLIYVLGYDVMSAASSTTFFGAQKKLYAYKSSGALKFSVNLSQ